ncbi:MAG: hypothetical protein Q7K98_02870 [Candidatus Omnitrophota bacterium]|nr:hypothetical protein [Candidatus Omnitrophota bacterium]
MDKEEAIGDFLKGLRIAINNSLAYSRQHPYFLKNSQDFKEKIDEILNFLNPVKVNVTPETLFLDGKDRGKVPFVTELARLLHQRKIKSVEIKPGLTVNEIADFLSFLSLQPKEIIKNGGLSRLLKNAESEHISVEDLDYSALLGAEGEEAKDIWLYMFKEAVEKQDVKKINEFADNFSQNVNKLSVNELVEDDKLRENLGSFLSHLKEEEKEKFSKCSQELSNVIMDSAAQISVDHVDKLKEIFKDFDSNDFSDVLLSRLSGESGLNALNLGLFSRLAGEDKANKITSGLLSKVEGRTDLKNNAALFKKITNLLSGTDAETVSPAYHAALTALMKDISTSSSLFFDREKLRVNYRMIMLNLFAQEESPEGLELIAKRLSEEWESIVQEKDYSFLRYLLDTLKKKKGRSPLDLLEGMEKKIAQIIESDLWDGELSGDLIYLADSLEKSYSTANFYLDKIFQEKKLSAYGLKLFLKFFPAELSNFYGFLKERHTDFELISAIIKDLAQVNLPVSLAVLKEIFSFGNELIKLEVLKAMQSAREFDPEFIIPLLKEKSVILRREALSVLLRDSQAKQKAISILLGIPSLWGMENQLILENIMIIEELNVREAKDYLILLGKKRFFWNRELRNRALKLLEQWK